MSSSAAPISTCRSRRASRRHGILSKGCAATRNRGQLIHSDECHAAAYSAGYGNNRVNCGDKIGKLYDGNKCRGFSHLYLSGICFIGKFYNKVTLPPGDHPVAGRFVSGKNPGIYRAYTLKP